MKLDRQSVYTVKIYFIEPAEIITVVMDALIKLEFETYGVSELDKDKLLGVLGKDIRNVVFLSIINEKQLNQYKTYIDRLNAIEDSHIQVGAFIHGNIKPQSRMELLERNTAVIQFSDIKQNTLGVLKKILMYFEAKGSRKYVRVRASGQSEAYYTVKNLETPLKGKVINISSQAFLAKIQPHERFYFNAGDYFHDVLLVLKGIRVRTSVKVIGFHKEAPEIFVFKVCSAKLINNKLTYIDKIPPENKNKLHNYIKICLKDSLTLQLRKET